MPSKHLYFVAAACAYPLSLAACGGSGSDNETPILPEGTHHGYVVSAVSVPTTSKEKADFGLDLGGLKSKALDGITDNKLGGLFQTLSGFIDINTAVNKAIATGTILLLVDFQTKDLANSSAAGFGVELGAMPNPPACTDMNDMTCGHHLDGHGSFQIAAGSPTDAVVGGKIVGGAFTGGPGDVTVQLALGGGTPITLSLVRARVRATTATAQGKVAPMRRDEKRRAPALMANCASWTNSGAADHRRATRNISGARSNRRMVAPVATPIPA